MNCWEFYHIYVGDSATDKRLLKNYEEFFEGYLFTNSIRQSDRVKTWFDFGITTNEAHDKIQYLCMEK